MNIMINDKKFFLLHIMIIFSLCIFSFAGCKLQVKDPLTVEERQWLAMHNGKIVLAHDPKAKPIDFIDEKGAFRGLAADYVELIEQRLDFKFNIVHLKTWEEVLEKARNKEVDVLCAFTKNSDRENWMLFTEPYIEIPTVIITRKDDERTLSLDKMKNMKVTFNKGWVVDDYLRTNYKDLNFVPAIDPKTAMNYLSSGQVDAWVTALTVAAIEIEKNKVSNLRIAGETDLSFKLAFASRKDWPILNRILDKGLSLIPSQERKNIFNKWIHIETESIFNSKKFWIGISIFIALLLLPVIFIALWNKSLKQQVEQKTTALKHELEERKRTEAALSESEEKYRYIVENSVDGFWIIDAKGKILEVNDSYCSMVGYSRLELLNMSVADIEAIEDEENISQRIMQIINTDSDHFETRHKCKDGSGIDVDIAVKISKDKTRLFAFLRDISDRKKLEAEFIRTQKIDAIGILAGGIAHDFNNMLGVITGNVSYALSILNKDEELFKILSDVQKGAKQAQTLTQQLLTFAQGGEPIKTAADINQLVKESAEFVTRGSKVKCIFDLSDDLLASEVDKGQLNQVISNLVINANQAMPDGGIIHIHTENAEIKNESILPLSSGRYIKITIKDQGLGISENHLSKIFDPYFTTKQKGSGLGLATSYSIIKKHMGHISVESVLNEGTSFYIYLPACDEKVLKNEDKTKSEFTGHGKILIMDDEEAILTMSGMIVNRIGHEAVLAEDGKIAIEIYKNAFNSEKPFDLVILDLTVPGGMGGAKTIGELLKIDPKVKAIVSSGYSNDPIMANYQDYGFSGVVPKPYTINQLAEVLNKVLGEKAGEKD